MVSRKDSNKARLKRHKRVRAKISGTAARPRLAVYRSNANISAQIIDDVAGKTLVSASTYGASYEGNTGPYILYTIVRIKSILAKYGAWENLPIQVPANPYAKDLMLAITKFGPSMEAALKAAAPNMVCAYIYELAGCVNKFYHETRILTEENEQLKAGYIALIGLAKNILETCINILGFSAPEKM